MTAAILLARLFAYAANIARDRNYPATHPRETAEAQAALLELKANHPHVASLLFTTPPKIREVGYLVVDSQVLTHMSQATRDMYNELLRTDPQQARLFLLRETMGSFNRMLDLLTTMAKTRSDMTMQVVRNLRG